MPAWKVLFIMLLGGVCFALGLATIVVPATLVEGGSRWLWLAGLFFATACMGTLFRLLLKSADRAMMSSRRH